MRGVALFCAALSVAVQAGPALAQQVSKQDDQQDSMAEMKRQIAALRQRVEELESRDRNAKSPTTRHPAVIASSTQGPLAAMAAQPPPGRSAANASAVPVRGLLPPEPMGRQSESGEGDDALRSDLPGLSLRIPGTQSEV